MAVGSAIEAASVKVTNGQKSGSGTCFATFPKEGEAKHYGLILTARHLTGHPDNFDVVFPASPSVKHPAFLVGICTKDDLAVLWVLRGNPFPTVAISEQPATVGASIIHCGYPGGRGPSSRRGVIEPFNSVPSRMFSRIQVQGGDSGGGVFRADDSTLIGVLVERDQMGHAGNSLAVPWPTVNEFVSQCCIRFPWRKPKPLQPTAPPVPPMAPATPMPAAPLVTPGKDGRDGKDGKDGRDADAAVIADLTAQIAALSKQVAGLKPGSPGEPIGSPAPPATKPLPLRVRVVPAAR